MVNPIVSLTAEVRKLSGIRVKTSLLCASHQGMSFYLTHQLAIDFEKCALKEVNLKALIHFDFFGGQGDTMNEKIHSKPSNNRCEPISKSHLNTTAIARFI